MKNVSWLHFHWVITLIEHIIISGAVSESRIVNSQELLKMLLVWHYCTSVCIQSSELITLCDAWFPSYRNCFSIWCVVGWILLGIIMQSFYIYCTAAIQWQISNYGCLSIAMYLAIVLFENKQLALHVSFSVIAHSVNCPYLWWHYSRK